MSDSPSNSIIIDVIEVSSQSSNPNIVNKPKDEEDVELVQAIAFNLNSLKQQYESEIIGQAQPKGQTDEG